MAVSKSARAPKARKPQRPLPSAAQVTPPAALIRERPPGPVYAFCDPQNPECLVLPRPGSCALILEPCTTGKHIGWRLAHMPTGAPREFGETLIAGHDPLHEVYLRSCGLGWSLHVHSGWLNISDAEMPVILEKLGVKVER